MEAKSIETSEQRRSGPGPDELRAQLHAMWSGVAGAWAAHSSFVDARGEAVTERMLALAAPRPGEHVLELACGTGGPGIEAAALVAPGGVVVQSDVSAAMASIAAEGAEALGLGTVQTRVLDLERIDEPDESYDVVLCREGLMLVLEPALAAGEIRRVLRPGGRVALTVWGPRARNPWLGVVFDAVSAHFGAPTPPPRVPHPFSLDDADQLSALLTNAGLSDVVVREISTPYHAASVDEWWERTSALAGPLAKRLAALPPAAAEGLRARAGDAIGVFATPNGLDIPGVSLLATARNAPTRTAA
jgi:SAM-dependent methyltransferase